MQIGFIGLGLMGHHMALNLKKQGHNVIGYDINQHAMQQMADKGIVPAQKIEDVAKQSDAVVAMLQTGDQVKSVCLGDKGLFSHFSKNALFIDCSSIDVLSSRELHASAEHQHIEMVDAPVSGGVAAAEAATLTFMVGGEPEAFKKAQLILEMMGKKIVHAGHAGCGAAAKICNNMILGATMIAVSEAFNLAQGLGLAPEKLFEICSNASGSCWSLMQYCPYPNILPHVPSSHDYRPGFTAKMMLKDLKLSQISAQITHVATPIGHEATKLYEAYCEDQHAETDFSGIIQWLKDY